MTYADMFEQAFPYYLAIGMTYEQYWEQDSWLVKAYRKAQDIRREEQNWNAWLQGLYVYEAIADIAPILHAFAKKGTRARKYSEKPYELGKPEGKKKKRQASVDPQKAKSDRIQAQMIAFMQAHNKEMARKRIEAMRETFMGNEPMKNNSEDRGVIEQPEEGTK